MLKYLYSLFTLVILIISCRKEPGTGGHASITGHVQILKYNGSATDTIGEFPGADEYVYIVYGDHPGYDKRVKTDYNGDFQFEFLYPGNYKVYTYSYDPSVLQEYSAMIQTATLDKKEELQLQDFIIYKP